MKDRDWFLQGLGAQKDFSTLITGKLQYSLVAKFLGFGERIALGILESPGYRPPWPLAESRVWSEGGVEVKGLKLATIAAMLVIGLGTSQAAHADTMWNLATGLTGDAAFSASGGSWTLTMSFTNTLATTATVNQFTLALFQPGTKSDAPIFGISSLSAGTGYFDSKGDNGTSTCSTAGKNRGWLCVDFLPGGYNLAPGTTTFSASGSYNTNVGPLDASTLDLISNGLTDNTMEHSKWAISAAGTGTSVPEPGTMSLLLLGLLGLVGFAGITRRRLAVDC